MANSFSCRLSFNQSCFLKGYQGYLQVDGYSGYNQVPDVTLVGCWTHARRKFDEAIKALPDSQQGKKVKASEGLYFCNQLYSIKRKLKHVDSTERYEQRKKSRPILDLFSAWLYEQKDLILPKSALGKAITYCLNQWNKKEIDKVLPWSSNLPSACRVPIKSEANKT